MRPFLSKGFTADLHGGAARSKLNPDRCQRYRGGGNGLVVLVLSDSLEPLSEMLSGS